MVKLTHICNFHNRIDLNEIGPIVNQVNKNKPSGGLWLSINEGWECWCASENGNPKWLKGPRYEFRLKKKAKILWIYRGEDLLSLPSNQETAVYWSELIDNFDIDKEFERFPDFEKISEEYDAMAVMVQSDIGHDLSLRLCGWDCDSMLVFNPEIIEGFEQIEPATSSI